MCTQWRMRSLECAVMCVHRSKLMCNSIYVRFILELTLSHGIIMNYFNAGFYTPYCATDVPVGKRERKYRPKFSQMRICILEKLSYYLSKTKGFVKMG